MLNKMLKQVLATAFAAISLLTVEARVVYRRGLYCSEEGSSFTA